MKSVVISKLINKEKINKDVYKFTVQSEELAKNSKPGQFIEVKCSKGMNVFLRRPFSISDIDEQKGIIEFIFQIRGKGTNELSEFEVNSNIDILGPLGNGFLIDNKYKCVAVIGGGVGIFPLYGLLKRLKSQNSVFLGFRDKSQIIIENNFRNLGDSTFISTDDGSFGMSGRITDIFIEEMKKSEYDIIYACGPKPMLKEVQKISIAAKIPCQLSLEEQMGCGVGACLGCACKNKANNDDEWTYKHICVDGPVFWGNEVIFDE